jgi:hypothetical protein
VTLALAAAIALASCGGGSDEMSSDAGVAPAMEPGFAPDEGFAVEERSAADAAMPAPGGGAGTVGTASAQAGRQVIRSAYLLLEVDDSSAAIAEITAIADEVGGYIAASALSRADDGTISGTLTVRVPSTELDAVVARFDALARAVPMRNIDEYDVTAQLTDIDARLANLRAYEEELRALLTEVRTTAGAADQLVYILDRLREVRTEIESTEAWRAQLTDQVELSTITVTVVPSTVGTPIGSPAWRPSDTVRNALDATVRAATRIVDGVIWFALTIVPVAAAVIIVLVVLVRLRRAWRRRRAAGTAA